MRFKEESLEKYDYYEVISLLLRNGEQVRMNLYGYCMRPFIRNGEDVTIKPVKPEELKCGDIIVYRFEDRFKIHRFLRFKTIANILYIIAKGDHCIHPDPPVSLDLLLGKIVYIYRKQKIISYEIPIWKVLNFFMGKLSPYISKTEYYIKSLILFPLKFANKCFKMVMGVGFLKYVKSLKRA